MSQSGSSSRASARAYCAFLRRRATGSREAGLYLELDPSHGLKHALNLLASQLKSLEGAIKKTGSEFFRVVDPKVDKAEHDLIAPQLA